MVSLALALGLSSLSSNRMKVESLFIDEGLRLFGPRGRCGSLWMPWRSLRTQGRKIGVISHVQEMTERIPVRIRVNRAGNHGRSYLEVIWLYQPFVMDLLDVVFVFGVSFCMGNLSHGYDVQRHDMIR